MPPHTFHASQVQLCGLTLRLLCVLSQSSCSKEALHVLLVSTLMLLLLITALLCFLPPAQQAMT